MTDKAKLKGLRPLSLSNPLTNSPLMTMMTLSPVTGAGNRIYRAEEATAPAEAQTLLLLSPAATESTSPAMGLAPQPVPVILPLGLSVDKTAAEPQSAGLPALGTLPPSPFTLTTPQPPLSGGLSSHGQAITPPDKGGFSELHRGFSNPPGGLAQQHQASSEPLALFALTSETQQRPYEVAFQTGSDMLDLLDLNQDTVITSQDAQVLYYLSLPQAPGNLETLLNNLNVTDPPTTLMSLNLLNPSATAAAIEALDLNLDGRIDLQDVRVLYYAYRFGDILRASASLRATLLSDLTLEDEGLAAARRDAVYLAMLERAAALRPPVPEGDHAFQVNQGASYTLTLDDLSVRDPDDANAPLIWMVTNDPDHGLLVLSTAPEVAIDEFTQQQLEDGEVVYVHDDSNTLSDSFEVQAADDGGARTDTVMLDVAVTAPPDLDNIDLSDLAVADGFIIQGDEANDRAGYSVSDAGDVNGDGFADLIVGAPLSDPDGGTDTGEAYVVFGKASNPPVVDLTELAPADGFIIQGDVERDQAGYSVSGAGDVNGDGFADLIVGTTFADVNTPDGDKTDAGEAYVVFGKAAGPSDPFGSLDTDTNRRVVDLTSLGAADGFIIQGDVERDYAGRSVSGAGDVNGDGFADLIVGARSGDDGGLDAGAAYVIFGKASGPSDPFGDPVTTGEGESAITRQVIDLTDLAPADGFIIQGDADFDLAGGSVSGAGDVNGDGYADLIVGARSGDDGDGNAGEAYVVFGKAPDPSDPPSNPFGNPVTTGEGESAITRQVIDLTHLGAADGFIIQGDANFDYAGVSVSGAGDVNGDGFADLIVGADRADVTTRRDAGEAYVVFGKAPDPSDPFGSLDPDTNRRVVDLAELTAGDGFIIQGDTRDDRAGVSVSGAGDVNGDGYADLIVGAPRSDDGDSRNVGEAYLIFGKAPDPSNSFGDPVTTGEGESAITRQVIDLTGLAPEDGLTIQGDAPGDFAGRSVSGAGDVNGDGYADLIVGAYRADVTTRRDAGEAYVLFGGPVGLATEAAAELGMDGDDVLNVDGQATVVLAGAGDDVLNIDGFGDTDLLKFDGGSGTDTLSLVNPGAGSSLSLDLSTLADTRLSSIEHIDLSGEGDNSLILTRLDLLNLSEVRTNGRAELRVDGNTGDSVTAPDDGWARSADVMIEGTMYRAFDNGNARLLVNMEVSLGGNLMATSMATLAEALQNCCVTQTVDIRAFIEDLPPEDEAQQRKRLEDELAMLGPLPAAKAAMERAEPAAVAEPDADLFDLPPLIPDDG